MSNLGKVFFLLATSFLVGCKDPSNEFKVESVQTIGSSEYVKIYKLAADTVDMWMINRLSLNTHAEDKDDYLVDSLLCFNNRANRLITCILSRNLMPDSFDALLVLYGEKINSQWYFMRGASIVTPRSMINGHSKSIPLSYQQLHEIALKEVYSGYLDSFGNINEDWFKQHFENVGMCAECKTSEDFKKSFYESAMAQWANRDTTQPIKHLKKTLP